MRVFYIEYRHSIHSGWEPFVDGEGAIIQFFSERIAIEQVKLMLSDHYDFRDYPKERSNYKIIDAGN